MKKKIEWLDFEKPTEKDLEFLKDKFGFHDVILKELQTPSARSRVESYDDYLYLTYYFPVYDPKEQKSHRGEIDFLITKHAIVTAHYEPFEFFKELKNVEATDSLRMLYALLGGFFRFEERQLRHIREKLEGISAELFQDRDKEMLVKISHIKRDISEYRLIVRSEETVLNSLRERGAAFWGENARVYLNDLAGDHLQVVTQIEDYRQTVADFESTNIQLMNMKTNDVMKKFTAMSFLTFPFVLFVALFDMHLSGNPLSSPQNSFWIAAGLVVIGIACLATYFKRKDWL